MEGETQQAQPVKITFTYESLFDLVVREKGRDEPQTLQPGFFADLVNYLNEKRSMLGLLSAEEKEKATRQLHNINRLIKELYERREKKIISFALARSRAGADIVDTSVLLAEEKAFFDHLVKQIDLFREVVLNNLLVAKMPDMSQQSQHNRRDEQYKQTGTETLAAASRIMSEHPTGAISGTINVHNDGLTAAPMTPTTTAHQQLQKNDDKDKATKLVRFLYPVPRFVGTELEVYGPFDQEDIANLPREIVEVLIAKGRAEEIAQA